MYRFDADYRSLAYYNNLPSFADPQLANGIALNEQSFDSRRHLGSYTLELFPGEKITPYFSFERDSEFGTWGIHFRRRQRQRVCGAGHDQRPHESVIAGACGLPLSASCI